MRKNNLLYLLIAFCFSACYDDMGNYSYREINTLEVEGIESLYSRDVDDSLHIVPVLQGTMYSDTSRFTYEWEIERSIKARTPEFHYLIDLTPGEKKCRYIVTDKETGIKSYASFRLNVSSSTAGDLIVILSKYKGHAEMSYLRLDKEANWVVNFYERRFGEILGNEPQQLLPCYMESSQAYPIDYIQGRLMVLCDNQIQLFDKSTMQRDTVWPYLSGENYTNLVAYPKPDVEGYKSQFMVEGISMWRSNPYGSGYQKGCKFIEISGGTVYSISDATNTSSPSYNYKVKSPYGDDGYLCPFAYWDDMSETPNDHLTQMGYSLGDLIVFDRVYGKFGFYENNSYMRVIPEEDCQAFPGYEMIWGSATNRPNNTSIAVISDGTSCCLLLLEDGTNATTSNATKKLVGNIGGGVITPSSKFYMASKTDNLFFSSGNALYRYNILDIEGKTVPSASGKLIDLTQLGYDASATIKDIFVSRTERTLLIAVSRYGSDTEGTGEELKGDLLYFDLNISNGTISYREDKSVKGISGNPVNVRIKYQTWWRNGLADDGVTIRDNI